MNVIVFFLGILIKRGRKIFAFNNCVKLLCFLNSNTLIDIMYKIAPVVGLMNTTLSGKLYKIPYFISRKKSIIIAFRWLIKALKLRSEKNFLLKLLGECRDILLSKSSVIKQRNEYHALAFENKQYLYLLRSKKRKRKNI